MDPCTIEVGLLRKKPCGHPAVAHCQNCERPLCSQHAVPQLNEQGHKSGKYLCKECQAAWREIEKHPPPAVPKKPAEKPGAQPGHAPAAGAKAPAPGAAKTAAPAGAKPAAAKPEEKKEEPAAKPADSGMIEFTPTKKP